MSRVGKSTSGTSKSRKDSRSPRPSSVTKASAKPKSKSGTKKSDQIAAKRADRVSVSGEAKKPEESSSRVDSILGGLIADKSSSEELTKDKLREVGAPDHAINHPAGPAAPPLDRFPPEELDENGQPKLGTLVNETNSNIFTTSHRYVTVNEINTDSREKAMEAFRGFNAPTQDALRGHPNPDSLTSGIVDATALVPNKYKMFDGVPGGHVKMFRGETPTGNPYAINSTTAGLHPLRGHITRSFIEHNGKFYVRTEGVGRGGNLPNPIAGDFGAGADIINSFVGPPTFHGLDGAMNGSLN